MNPRNPIIPWAGCIIAFACTFNTQAQEGGILEGAEIHGNFEVYAQTYNKDSLIGAPVVPQKSGINSYMNLIVTKGPFSAGTRIESYFPQVQGFDPRFATQPIGIPFRYARYAKDNLDITIGNFYEQFGNGLVLRSYEERSLGIDNAFDGVRVKYSPYKGIYLKGMIGNQRYYWQKSAGYVRGLDGEIQVNELVEKLAASKLRMALGGSFVSKFEDGSGSTFTLPENVAAFAGRGQLGFGGFGLSAEYAYKINDPSLDNNFIYRDGQAFFMTASYSRKGFGVNIAAKTIDNMSFRSERNAKLNDVFINYLPAITRQHTYNLAATLYPYATQPNGEIGAQADIIYKIKKETWYGGKYGTTIMINASMVNAHDTQRISTVPQLLEEEYLPGDPTREGYETDLFSAGDKTYYKDFNVEIDRKFNSWFKMKLTYVYLEYNIDLIQGTATGRNVYANVGIWDGLFKLSKKHSVRVEAQHLWTEQDKGNWAFALIEYGYSPHWFVTVLNQYNYGNPNPDLRLHYPTAQVVYIQNATRFSVGYGRQRAGIFCVGGVCRNVPAANGLTLSITHSF